MKKNVLALSIAAMIGGLGFAGAASAALSVADSGTGHILLVPYYTAQNDNMSVLHVVNTDTTHGKAVKVRFRGAANSDDVLDFQLFLSPGDVWTAAVTKGEDGRAQLTTSDNSCTLPTVKGAAVPFVTARLNQANDAATLANNTREGYVEILNMGDIDNAATYTVGGVANKNSALYTATKHVNGVAPCTDSVLQGTLAWDNTTAAATSGLLAPTGGLLGSWYVINVPQTTVYSGADTAITSSNPITATTAFSPQSNATGAASTLYTADPLFRTGVLTLQGYDVPDLSTPIDLDYATPEAQASALTLAIAHTSVINQYATDSDVSLKTDWLLSQPTRRYSIAANYLATVTTGTATVAGAAGAKGTASSAEVGGTITYGGTATGLSGATGAYRVANSDVSNSPTAAGTVFYSAGNTSVSNGLICLSSIGQNFRDREESVHTSGAVFSPGNVSNLPLCGEVNVLSFASGSVLGASVASSTVNSAAAYTNGWGQVNFTAPGVPLLGSAFFKATNPLVSTGVSGTYGITWPHAYVTP